MEKLIQIPIDNIKIEGMLKIPQGANEIVLFAHGSGSSRLSPRNNYVANILNQAGLGTLLIDLLTPQEDENYQTRFDIDLLVERLEKVVNWLKDQDQTKNQAVALFGSSTGAAAALRLAAKLGNKIQSVVSRGGRPDLANKFLHKVISPTLFIVGGSDFGVIELNQESYEKLNCTKAFEIVPHATHLFEEPGCLEEVARLAKEWFIIHQDKALQSSKENR